MDKVHQDMRELATHINPEDLPPVMHSQLAQNFNGQNALDFMNSQVTHAVLPMGDTGGPAMPPELMNKTIAQLKAMGATEVSSFHTNAQISKSGMTESPNMIDERID